MPLPSQAEFMLMVQNSLYPQDKLPAVLAALPRSQKEQLECTLANDENSSDEELVEFWTTECGIARDAAEEAVKFRDTFFSQVLFRLFDFEQAA